MSEKSARVHRFQNKVAIDTTSMHETVYISKDLAKKFALAILDACEDIENCPKFHLSTLKTQEYIEGDG